MLYGDVCQYRSLYRMTSAVARKGGWRKQPSTDGDAGATVVEHQVTPDGASGRVACSLILDPTTTDTLRCVPTFATTMPIPCRAYHNDGKRTPVRVARASTTPRAGCGAAR